MKQATREWLAGLRQRVADSRCGPGPAGPAGCAGSPAAAAAERMILATHLSLWLDHDVPSLMEQRRKACLVDADPYPVIVITTSPVGIAVVDEAIVRGEPVVASVRDQLVAVTEREYRDWTKSHPDPEHLVHLNHWSWVKTSVPAARRDEFAAFPLAAGESFWLHRTGTTGCGPERRFCHLWRWSGTTAVLVRPFIAERVRRL